VVCICLRSRTPIEGDGEDILRVAKEGAFNVSKVPSNAARVKLFLLPPWLEKALETLLKMLETMITNNADQEGGKDEGKKGRGQGIDLKAVVASASSRCATALLSSMPVVGSYHPRDGSFTFDPIDSWQRELYYSQMLGNADFGANFVLRHVLLAETTKSEMSRRDDDGGLPPPCKVAEKPPPPCKVDETTTTTSNTRLFHVVKLLDLLSSSSSLSPPHHHHEDSIKFGDNRPLPLIPVTLSLS
jgi:hypothetical protein